MLNTSINHLIIQIFKQLNLTSLLEQDSGFGEQKKTTHTQSYSKQSLKSPIIITF